MISKQRVKFIKSLQYKKYRKKAHAFLVEGSKSVVELLSSGYQVLSLIATSKFYREHGDLIRDKTIECYETDEDALSKMGTFQSNDYVLAVASIKVPMPLSVDNNEHLIALQALQDPGNLGTIIRTADWYGLSKVLVSPDTVDFYNPKVISATKGSFTRVQVYEVEFETFLNDNPQLNVYGTYMHGASIYETKIDAPSIIFFGNESRGLGKGLSTKIHQRLMIPRIGAAESLNVAIAAALVMDHIHRPWPL
jgi:TrmH family RNA methyltransferase